MTLDIGLFFPVVCSFCVFDQSLPEQLYHDKGLLGVKESAEQLLLTVITCRASPSRTTFAAVAIDHVFTDSSV